MYFNEEPQWQKEVIRELAKKYDVDMRVIRFIVYYPYVFMSGRINDFDDYRPIRHRRLGAFVLKIGHDKNLQKAKKESERITRAFEKKKENDESKAV
jgi:hypothetical protein